MFARTVFILLFSVFIFPEIIFSQISEKEITTEIAEVKIHLRGAEVIRNSKVNLSTGKHLLIFNHLSPKINPTSIQVTADGNVTILSTTNRTNFLKEQKKRQS